MAATGLRFTRAERGLGLWWVAANIVGWVIGFAVCEVVKAFLFALTHFNSDGLVIGAAMGTAQWLVLRRQIAPLGWWVIVSIVGFGAGRLIGDAAAGGLSGILGGAVSGVILGGCVGIAQWLVSADTSREPDGGSQGARSRGSWAGASSASSKRRRTSRRSRSTS